MGFSTATRTPTAATPKPSGWKPLIRKFRMWDLVTRKFGSSRVGREMHRHETSPQKHSASRSAVGALLIAVADGRWGLTAFGASEPTTLPVSPVAAGRSTLAASVLEGALCRGPRPGRNANP